ncbi:MAG TPA: PAS domain S-box protein, partial [Caldilineae bacterium]|nr:PAS domain S-box protein [Caldilineae bacterium]
MTSQKPPEADASSTEAKRMPQGQETWRQLVELLPDGVAIHRQGKLRFLNKSARKILGIAEDAEIGELPVMQFVHPDYRHTVAEGIQRLLETGERKPFSEEKFVRLDGTEIDVEVAGFPFIENGEIAVQVVFRDITERKKRVQILREREAWYNRLVNLLPDGVVIHSQGKIRFLNKSALKITGITSADEVIGQSALKFVHPDYRQVAAERIQRLLATGKSTPFIEEKFIRPDGSEFDVEVAAFPFTERGETAVQVVFRDITARKQAEQTLQQHAHRLELLSEIDRASLTAQPMEEIARSALVSLRELIPCQRASVALFESPPSISTTVIAVETS